MSFRTFTDKNGNTWEWNETPEVVAALDHLHQTVKGANEKKFAGNYPGPLYAPHPDLSNENKTNT
jgi:hypothetical protein